MDTGSRTEAQRGQGSLEYVAVVLVGALVLTALLMTQMGPQVKSAMGRAVCEVTSYAPGGGGGCADSGDEITGPIDYEPDSCTVATSGTTHEGGVSIAFIDLGGSHGVSIAEVRHADGRVEYLVTHEGEGKAGASLGIGGKGKNGDENPSAALEGDIGVEGSYTDGRTFRTDSLEEARALQDRLLGNPWDTGGREPLTETVTWGGEAEGSIDLGVGLPADDSGDPGKGQGEGEEGGEIGAGASISGGHSYATTTNYETGETTYTTAWNGEVTANGDVLEGANASGTWSGATSISIVRDANGQITKIEMETVTESGSTLEIGGTPVAVSGQEGVDTVTTTSLDVTDANRATVEQWLGSAEGNYLGIKPLQTLTYDPRTYSTDPMQALLYNEAQVTQISMQNWEDSYEIGGEVKWGLKLGASYTKTDSTAEVIEALYALEGVDGHRPMAPLTVCYR